MTIHFDHHIYNSLLFLGKPSIEKTRNNLEIFQIGGGGGGPKVDISRK